MSMTDFLRRPEIQQKFRKEFRIHRLGAKKELLAAPQTNRYSLIGTAFDYLLRFHIERHVPKAEGSEWVSKKGLERLPLCATAVYYIDDGEFVEAPAVKAGQSAFKRALAAYSEYMESGEITDRLLRGVIHLAKLDTVYRCGFVDENMGGADRADVRDLRNLLGLVNLGDFRAKRLCLLNPGFAASKLVGGADADLVIDSMLVDVKTTKRFELSRETFNQLIGYMLLHEMGGFDGAKSKQKITRLGVYFSRFGHLEAFDVKDIVNPETFPAFRQWFFDTVEGERQQRVEAPRKRAVEERRR